MTVLIVRTICPTTPKLPGLQGERGRDTNGHRDDRSMTTSSGSSSKDKRSEHSSEHGKNNIETESMFGSSTSRYRYRKAKDFKAKGKLRSRGIGKYGKMSSASTDFVVEGKIGKYGHRKPLKSKFKTRGKEKKYSRKISDNRFDIKGDLYERRQHAGIGDYQANGSYINVKLKTHQQNGSKNKTHQNLDQKAIRIHLLNVKTAVGMNNEGNTFN
ncbi:hypothetical protein EWB00_009324 [Schistosoma japonicum]|uniref:Uncharacterized protein n=1 Tax=Schistosoma japonicum TaxID=6182 RepID=A0A4Z2CM99_SCHJA|nr:hypothetical protein EWB00_009324 [Schistosoma japonicum]